MNYTSIFGTQNRKTKLGLVLLGLFFCCLDGGGFFVVVIGWWGYVRGVFCVFVWFFVFI